jgi:photosynthetic reaction center H subunit
MSAIHSLDLTQILLYLFWAAFAALLYYLHREDKREGYPLQGFGTKPGTTISIQGFPVVPDAKTFRLADGSTVQAPRGSDPQPAIAAAPVAPWPGAPLQPTGNPMIDGVGPAAYALRAEVPERMLDGSPMIVPLRVATDHGISPHDTDPRGFTVLGCDGQRAGTVGEVWVDRSEPQVRYLEVNVDAGGTALLPAGFVRYDMRDRRVKVAAITAAQFATVPQPASRDQVTKREEDRITAYFAGGHLYATADRIEPLL